MSPHQRNQQVQEDDVDEQGEDREEKPNGDETRRAGKLVDVKISKHQSVARKDGQEGGAVPQLIVRPAAIQNEEAEGEPDDHVRHN